MPPITRGGRGREIPEDNFFGRGRGRGRVHGRGPRDQNIAGVGQFDQNVGVGNNQDN